MVDVIVTDSDRAALAPLEPGLPPAYALPDGEERHEMVTALPAVLFLEVTNRCNLHCATCVRLHRQLPPADLSDEAFVEVLDQLPTVRRLLLHGIGEPLLHPRLPELVGEAKSRGHEVLFNTNGSLLTPQRQRAMVLSGLDELRCSIDAASRETYLRARGADCFDAVVSGLRGLAETKVLLGASHPAISLWFVATRDNLHELPALIRLAASIGVPEVYVQRLVYFAAEPGSQYGSAREELAVFARLDAEQERILAQSEMLADGLGVSLHASGASTPSRSLHSPNANRAWQSCLRPWTSAYITAEGDCLPCCIAPFSSDDYQSLVLGNVFREGFAAVWNGERYRHFRARFLSDDPHPACVGCGAAWSL